MLERLKTYAWRAAWVAFYAIGAVMLLGHLSNKADEPRPGDPCGAGNHWRMIGHGAVSELSCEPDAP